MQSLSPGASHSEIAAGFIEFLAYDADATPKSSVDVITVVLQAFNEYYRTEPNRTVTIDLARLIKAQTRFDELVKFFDAQFR